MYKMLSKRPQGRTQTSLSSLKIKAGDTCSPNPRLNKQLCQDKEEEARMLWVSREGLEAFSYPDLGRWQRVEGAHFSPTEENWRDTTR